MGFLKSINDEQYDEMIAKEKENIKTMKDKLQTGAIYLNPKIDSKNQRRLQCSFNRFKDFMEQNPKRIIAKSNTNEFRGGKISKEIKSSRRNCKEK